MLVHRVLGEGWRAARLQEGRLADVALDVLCLLVLFVALSACVQSRGVKDKGWRRLERVRTRTFGRLRCRGREGYM